MVDFSKISIIIPCYNEGGNLEECIRRIPRDMGNSLEIILVNDGSRDNTRETARRIINEHNSIKLIDFFSNRGKTEAVKEGIRLASGGIIMIQDADLSVPPECLKVFYERILNEPDTFITGTRFLCGMKRGSMPLRNRLANKITAHIFSFILKQELTDALCGTKVFGAELKNYLNFSNCRWPDFDLLIAAHKMGLRIREIPVEYYPRKYGKSSMRIYPDVWQLFTRMIKAVCELKWAEQG